ncbi:MAG: DUF5060 domain-containing protein [Chloroflexota bacterium]
MNGASARTAPAFSWITVCLLLAVSALSPGGQTATAEATRKWQVHEVSLTSTHSYANPFTEVDLTATVTDPAGTAYTVRGFFDGDGAGGQVGGIWKFRVSPDSEGTWRWTTASNDSELDRRSGTFSVAGAIEGPFGAGALSLSAEAPRYFKYRDGGHVFLVGKFLEQNLPDGSLRYSHVLPSAAFSDADREELVARHVGMQLNKVNLYVANRGDYGGKAVTPWVVSPAGEDRTRFDLAYWRLYDRWIERLLEERMVAEIWFFADDSRFGSLSTADRERLLSYTMARLSAYANTAFVHSLEWQEGFSAAKVESDARFLGALNPWQRLLSVHCTPGDFSFPRASWLDFMATQAGFNTGHAAVNRFALKQRTRSDKPHLLEEFAHGTESANERKEAWAAFLGGAAGIGTGASLQHLAAFVPTTRFHLMEPDNALLISGAGYVLAAGEEYIVYLPSGGSAVLDLSGAVGTLAGRWYNPRTGVYTYSPDVQGGGHRGFRAPDANDWVLHLQVVDTAPSSGSVGGYAATLSPVLK